MESPHIAVNEIFGPTLQGEGPDVGKPCFFLRLHHCPVHCPGCDTHYTWDGSERPRLWTYPMVFQTLTAKLKEAPGCGLVVSGGEPLLHYASEQFNYLLNSLRLAFPWRGLETSGYAGGKPLSDYGTPGVPGTPEFFGQFTSISLSPKITPCLHGHQTDEELEINLPLFLRLRHRDVFLKFVVRGQVDIDAVLACNQRHQFIGTHSVYLMPYGNDRDGILRSIDNLIPAAAKYGFTITPRLHSLLWGAARGK